MAYFLRGYLLLLAFVYAGGLRAQKAIEIKYIQTPLFFKGLTGSNIRFSSTTLRQVFNDHYGISYSHTTPYNPWRNRKKIGHQLIHGAFFTDHSKEERFNEFNLTDAYKYLIEDSVIAYQWQPLNEEKVVLGYRCHALLSVKNSRDSIIVWYTRQLSVSTGRLWYDSIPGTVLEVFDQVRNVHIVASSIRNKKIKLLPPAEGIRVNMQRWMALKPAIFRTHH